MDTAAIIQIAELALFGPELRGRSAASSGGPRPTGRPRPQQDGGSSRFGCKYELERRSELLFSSRHLQAIFDDPGHLHRFSSFLCRHRPTSVPLLRYSLDALKALRAIEYSNAVLRQLAPLTNLDFTHPVDGNVPTVNEDLQAKAHMAFELLAREDLPMYVTHVWIQTVTVSIRERIMGTARHSSEGLAEVFCLTDPSRHDNPIVFMTEEFNKTTQYGVDYIIGRNCRFLQGPNTNLFSVRRIREKLEAGVEHYETFLNYRRDGSPFMNLVMLAPLYDSRGVIRYFIGAQVDVSGLASGCYGLGALQKLVDEEESGVQGEQRARLARDPRCGDEFVRLAEILSRRELEIVQDRGGDMHRLVSRSEGSLPHCDTRPSTKRPSMEKSGEPLHGAKNRVVLQDSDSHCDSRSLKGVVPLAPNPSTTAASLASRHNGRLTGVYENYLLVRPYPSLRILFTSPSMRVPGILQSPLLDRIGGSARIREQLVQALADGQGVTAKVRWLSGVHRKHGNRPPPRKKTQYAHPLEVHLDLVDDADMPLDADPAGRPRWIHCTPLVGSNAKFGVWMIVIVDDEPRPQQSSGDMRRRVLPQRNAVADPQGHSQEHPGTGAGSQPSLRTGSPSRLGRL
ncbi:hypothetical protein RJ55_06955 [Drechmeria coniospora]|nr:hypothetical protein RJ55_06955 [Drechmeria coniospora]